MPLLRTDLKDKTMKGPQILSPLPSKAVSSADGLMQYSSLNSVATALLEIKEVIFMQTKMTIWNQAIKETTTPTSAPPDEYERPEDLKEININRVEARNVHSMNMKDSLSFSERLKISVFGQLKVITLLSTVSKYQDMNCLYEITSFYNVQMRTRRMRCPLGTNGLFAGLSCTCKTQDKEERSSSSLPAKVNLITISRVFFKRKFFCCCICHFESNIVFEFRGG